MCVYTDSYFFLQQTVLLQVTLVLPVPPPRETTTAAATAAAAAELFKTIERGLQACIRMYSSLRASQPNARELVLLRGGTEKSVRDQLFLRN